MNARYAELITGEAGPEAWAQAGDQLYVDLDLSQENLPGGHAAGRRAAAIIEIQAEPHTGCAQFAARFGAGGDAAGQLRARAAPCGFAAPTRRGRPSVGSCATGDVIRRCRAEPDPR